VHKFGKTGKVRLGTCHIDLQLIMYTALSVSDVDFGIAEGHRIIEKQRQYFLEGKSMIDGETVIGKHNFYPSLAVDIYAWVEGKICYDKESISYIAGLIMGVSRMLLKEGRITHKVRWGGNWDMDGTILIDQSFDDRPHFELCSHDSD